MQYNENQHLITTILHSKIVLKSLLLKCTFSDTLFWLLKQGYFGSSEPKNVMEGKVKRGGKKVKKEGSARAPGRQFLGV